MLRPRYPGFSEVDHIFRYTNGERKTPLAVHNVPAVVADGLSADVVVGQALGQALGCT